MDRLRDRRSGGDPALKRTLRWRSPRPPRSLRATRPGWCFIAIIFGVGFAALNTGNNLLYLVFALMLAFLVLSGLLSESSLRGVTVERSLPREVFAGEGAAVRLSVRNTKRRVAAFALSIEDRAIDSGGSDGAGRIFVLRVAAGSAIDRSYRWVPRRRGASDFERIRISTRFPFGLFVKSVELEAKQSVLVYPALVPLGPVGTGAASARGQADERAGASTSGDAVAGVRDFRAGDPPRRIHWRRSVRSGRLVVGEREGERAAEIDVLLHAGADQSSDALEARISLAASEIVHHLAAGRRVGLRTRLARFVPDRGPRHRARLLTFLARLAPERAEDAPLAPERGAASATHEERA